MESGHDTRDGERTSSNYDRYCDRNVEYGGVGNRSGYYITAPNLANERAMLKVTNNFTVGRLCHRSAARRQPAVDSSRHEMICAKPPADSVT